MLIALAAGSTILAQSSIFDLFNRHPVRVGAWTYEVREDRFTYLKSCTLRTRGVTYDHKAVTFHLGRSSDTSGALYRIDSAAAQPWRASSMELAADGVALSHDSLDNPSQGLVPLPARLLGDAHIVWIRANKDASPVRFKIEGLQKAIAAAKAAGCPAASFD